jgi:hypothetical protein
VSHKKCFMVYIIRNDQTGEFCRTPLFSYISLRTESTLGFATGHSSIALALLIYLSETGTFSVTFKMGLNGCIPMYGACLRNGSSSTMTLFQRNGCRVREAQEME